MTNQPATGQDFFLISRDQLADWIDRRDRDPFAELDHAMAGVRLLSKAIASAAERGDARAIRGLSDLREQLSDDVTVLLRETVVELPECLR